VRASLDAGSNDNVTCLVADISEGDVESSVEPMLVGAAAELPRRGRGMAGLFRGHRSGDTGELEPVKAEIPDEIGFAIPSDPIDPEQARYAPQPPRRFTWLRRVMLLLVVVGLLWIAGTAAWSWTQQQYYVGSHDGKVTIFRGVDAELPGLEMSTPYEVTDLEIVQLSEYDRGQVEEGIGTTGLDSARRAVDNLVPQSGGEGTDGS
jgi:PPM family protein phosphatase